MKEDNTSIARKAGKIILDFGRKFISEEEKRAFYEGVEEGINRSISMLVEMHTKEDEAIRVLNIVWDIPASEALERIANEKGNRAIKSFKDYLGRQGSSAEEIDAFMKDNMVAAEIRRNADLREKYDNPKLIKNHFKE